MTKCKKLEYFIMFMICIYWIFGWNAVPCTDKYISIIFVCGIITLWITGEKNV